MHLCTAPPDGTGDHAREKQMLLTPSLHLSNYSKIRVHTFLVGRLLLLDVALGFTDRQSWASSAWFSPRLLVHIPFDFTFYLVMLHFGKIFLFLGQTTTQAGPAQAHVANKTWRVTNKIVALLPHCSFLQMLLHLILTPHLVQVCSACVWVNSYCCHSYSFIVMGDWDPQQCLQHWRAGNNVKAWQQDSNATWNSKATWDWKKEEAELQAAAYAEVLEGPVVKRTASRHEPAWSNWMISQYHAALDQKLVGQAVRIDMLTSQLAEMHTLLDSITRTHMEAEVRNCTIISENQRINELEHQLAELHALLDNPSQSEPPSSSHFEKSDDSCDDDNEKPDDYKRIVTKCIKECVHTGAFPELATQVDFQGWNTKTTTPDGNALWQWISRLQGMNIPIALLGTSSYGLLYDRLCTLAQQGKTFTLDSHQNGKYNTFACTSIICNECMAKLVIRHPGLPAKGGKKADADLITEVNQQLVHFLFTQEEIEEHNLLADSVCTIERHFRGSVKALPTPTICSPLKVDNSKKFKLNMFPHILQPPGLTLTSCGPDEIGSNTAHQLALVPRAPASSAIMGPRSSSVSTSSSSTSKLAARPQITTRCTWSNIVRKGKQIGS